MANERWKIDKHIPVAMIAAFIVQAVVYATIAGFYAAKQDSRILALEQYQTQQARELHDKEGRIQSIERDVPVIREKIQNIERTTDRIEKKIDKISMRYHDKYSMERLLMLTLKELGEIRVTV